MPPLLRSVQLAEQYREMSNAKVTADPIAKRQQFDELSWAVRQNEATNGESAELVNELACHVQAPGAIGMGSTSLTVSQSLTAQLRLDDFGLGAQVAPLSNDAYRVQQQLQDTCHTRTYLSRCLATTTRWTWFVPS
jgi:hypothetical protein